MHIYKYEKHTIFISLHIPPHDDTFGQTTGSKSYQRGELVVYTQAKETVGRNCEGSKLSESNILSEKVK